MIALFKNITAFFKSTLSENGVGSFSRVHGSVVTIACIGWVTYLVLKNNSMPDLAGVALLLGSGAVPYAANQARAAYSKEKVEVPKIPLDTDPTN